MSKISHWWKKFTGQNYKFDTSKRWEFPASRDFNVLLLSPKDAKKRSSSETVSQGAVACFIHDGVKEGTDLIIVPWQQEPDTLGRPQPDFFALGHEVWHMLELGGALYHGSWLMDFAADGWEERACKKEEAERMARLEAQSGTVEQ